MRDAILKALAQLDTENDIHWTQGGAPNVQAVEEILGDKTTRKDINDAAPIFTRANPALPESDGDDPNANETTAGSGVPDVDDESDEPDESDLTAPTISEKKAAQAEIDAARQELKAAQEKLRAATMAMDELIRAEKRAQGQRSHAQTVKAYQRSQQEQRKRDADDRKAMSAFARQQRKEAKGG